MAFKKLIKFAKDVIIAALFHPIYSIVNAIVLGHRDSPEQLAGLGLGSLTIGLIGLSIVQSFSSGVGTFITQAYGRQEFRMCAVYRNRAIFLTSILYLALFTVTLFIDSIYKAIG